jgi:hypothetical protein
MPFAAQRWHAQVTCLLGVALSFSAWQAEAQITLDVASTKAALARLSASASTQDVTEWVLHSADHQGLPFVVIDKRDARVFVFSPGGRFLGASPALLGLAIGDEGVAGLGERPLAQISPEERTTPAGRYLAALDRNLSGQTILWVDYSQSISMHPVRSVNPAERRLERLTSPSVQDNRISYGCINVPALFWRLVILPTFRGTYGIVYVLPENRSLESVFTGMKMQKEAAAI